MASKYYTFTGISKWAKVRKPDDKYDNFSIQLYMDEDSWNTFDNTGLSLVPKEDDDGHYVTFRRPNKKLINGEVAEFGPPEVIGTDGLIGNGSKVKVDVVVYDTQKGKGHRLNKITVLDLVKYDPSSSPSVPTPPVANPGPEVKTPSRRARPF